MKSAQFLALVYLFLTAAGVFFIIAAAQLNQPIFALLGSVIGLVGAVSLNTQKAR